MNEHEKRIKLISQLLKMTDDTFIELRTNLINKRIRCKVYEQDEDYNVYPKEIIATVVNLSFYEYDITITVEDDSGYEFYVSDLEFEVIE